MITKMQPLRGGWPADAGAAVTVLHVLPSDLARGSQVHARALRQVLDQPGCSHRLLTVFDGPDHGLAPDEALRVPSGRLRATGLDPRVVLRLGRALGRLRPDVVVAHGGETLKYLAVLPRRRRLVFFAIGTVGAKVHRWPHRLLYTVLCRRAHLVVGVSREVVEECADLLGVPRPKLVVAPNGRDPDRYHPAPRTGGTPVLLFVGHLTVHKRPDLFVEAVDRLRRRGIDLSAAIVGGGPMEAALRAPAGAAGVELLGERNDVPELLGAADVLVFTSSGESEGMPGVLIEAGLSGVPVVATDVAGVADVVDPGRTGLIVPPGDVDAVVEAVAALLADPARRLEFGRAARERCVERFSIEAGAAVWRRCIDDLANGGR